MRKPLPPTAAPYASGRPYAIERLTLTAFRNYASTVVAARVGPIVVLGRNGSGKTNLLEAISLLSPGRGLRGVPFAEIAQRGDTRPWAVAARVHGPDGTVEIGTGMAPQASGSERETRRVRIDGAPATGTASLAEHVEILWLTPAMDGLFTGPAAERRRFLDKLIAAFDPHYRAHVGRFDRAMRQRNRLLEEGAREPARFHGLEIVMAEAGAALAAARNQTIDALRGSIAAAHAREPASAFPWIDVTVAGILEDGLRERPAVEVEDAYLAKLAAARPRDRAAGRALDGPHRSDLIVRHGPKQMPAHLCSTGEQKALLTGLVLAHAAMLGARRRGAAPILLLDEIAAHFDEIRRAALFRALEAIGGQCWMTGTEAAPFAAVAETAQILTVEDGAVRTHAQSRAAAGA